jgi:hypothetical protein
MQKILGEEKIKKINFEKIFVKNFCKTFTNLI